MEKNLNNLVVPDYLLEKQKDKVVCYSDAQFNDYIKSIGVKNEYHSNSSNIYYYDKKIIKEFIDDPKLWRYVGFIEVRFNGKDVVNNLFNLASISHKNVANPTRLYVVDGILKAYEMPNMNGIKLNQIDDLMDIKIADVFSAWKNAYNLADFYTNYGIIMYDLSLYNSCINKSELNIFDVDFYKKVYDINKKTNISIVNHLFRRFLEDIFEKEKFELSSSKKFINKKSYIDEAYKELSYKAKMNSNKTLKDIKRSINNK